MKSKYIDTVATMNVLGNIYTNPMLLDAGDKYFFNSEDFVNKFQTSLFYAMYNLFDNGVKTFDAFTIEEFLSQRPDLLATYKKNKGAEFLDKIAELADRSTFDYYYNRMKKMSLFRGYEQLAHMDLSWLYDPDEVMDLKKRKEQEDWFDKTSISDMADQIDLKILDIRSKFADDSSDGSAHVGDGINELIDELIATPEIGYPLFGSYTNTVLRGARLKKFYLRSAATGVGKSRSMVADAMYIGCSQMYDLATNKWITIGKAEPVVYIATEQSLDEIQTMALAFLSGVDEDHILYGEYWAGELERVRKAAQLLKDSKVQFEALPDFSLKDIENTIKRNVRQNGCKYVFLDYLHTSMKILEEITKRSGGVRLREDNILFMISIRLKDLCNEMGIFIMSATQLNGDYVQAKEYDQNLLRGAKSIADKIDAGMIMLETSQEDIESLQPIIAKLGCEQPVIKISVYKNRRGRWKGVLLWCKANRGICRIEPMFVTKYNYEYVEMEDLKIKVEDESVF